MDDLDLKIINLLQRDGRKPNLEVARELGTSESTVRRRIDHLVKSKVVQFTALTDPHKLGFTFWVLLGIEADLDKIEAIAKRIAAFPEVFFLGITTGEYDLLLAAVFRSNDELYRFVTERLGKIKGIRRTFMSNVLRLVKRTFAYGLPAES